MDALEAIATRQSIGKVKPDPVPRALLEQLLHAAVQAPNHHRVRPWRFAVITGAGLNALGELMARGLKRRKPEAPEEVLQVERAKPLRAPVIIAVGVDKPTGKAVEIENLCAAAAATQNMLLAAHALGLAAFWRTGPAALDPEVKAFVGLEADQHLIGLVYLGYPLNPPAPANRPSADDRTRWIEG